MESCKSDSCLDSVETWLQNDDSNTWETWARGDSSANGPSVKYLEARVNNSSTTWCHYLGEIEIGCKGAIIWNNGRRNKDRTWARKMPSDELRGAIWKANHLRLAHYWQRLTHDWLRLMSGITFVLPPYGYPCCNDLRQKQILTS